MELDSREVISILDFFDDLEDPRSSINRKHRLVDIMVICVAAVVAGCDGPKSIGIWTQSKKAWCEKYLELPNGLPSHDTIGRVLAIVSPSAFQACFAKWVDFMNLSSEFVGPLPQKQIAIDGKALRRSHDRKNNLGALFLVSAWAVERGISLGQLATEEKSNEITAIPELINNIEVRGAVVSIDAAGCQKNIAKQIVDDGGDYVLALKGNQGTIHQQIIDWIDAQFENDWEDVSYELFETDESGHGRNDLHSYIQFPIPDGLVGREKWAGLKTIGFASRISIRDGQETIDNRYYLNSLELNVRRFASVVRGHWAIENTLHWCLDVTFREDESRLRNRIAGENVAWLKRMAISLVKQSGSKESIAMQRRMAGWNDDYLSQLLGLKGT